MKFDFLPQFLFFRVPSNFRGKYKRFEKKRKKNGIEIRLTEYRKSLSQPSKNSPSIFLWRRNLHIDNRLEREVERRAKIRGCFYPDSV